LQIPTIAVRFVAIAATKGCPIVRTAIEMTMVCRIARTAVRMTDAGTERALCAQAYRLDFG